MLHGSGGINIPCKINKHVPGKSTSTQQAVTARAPQLYAVCFCRCLHFPSVDEEIADGCSLFL
eukprot:scaffold66_cov115-Cylindrotheca_fusiformis.AAC.9